METGLRLPSPWAIIKDSLRILLRKLFWLDPLPPRPTWSRKATPIMPQELGQISLPIKNSQPTFALEAPTQAAITITPLDKNSDPLLILTTHDIT